MAHSRQRCLGRPLPPGADHEAKRSRRRRQHQGFGLCVGRFQAQLGGVPQPFLLPGHVPLRVPGVAGAAVFRSPPRSEPGTPELAHDASPRQTAHVPFARQDQPAFAHARPGTPKSGEPPLQTRSRQPRDDHPEAAARHFGERPGRAHAGPGPEGVSAVCSVARQGRPEPLHPDDAPQESHVQPGQAPADVPRRAGPATVCKLAGGELSGGVRRPVQRQAGCRVGHEHDQEVCQRGLHGLRHHPAWGVQRLCRGVPSTRRHFVVGAAVAGLLARGRGAGRADPSGDRGRDASQAAQQGEPLLQQHPPEPGPRRRRRADGRQAPPGRGYESPADVAERRRRDQGPRQAGVGQVPPHRADGAVAHEERLLDRRREPGHGQGAALGHRAGRQEPVQGHSAV